MRPGGRGPAILGAAAATGALAGLFGLFGVLLVLPFTLGKPPPEPSGAAEAEA